jgi:hypothetical protein
MRAGKHERNLRLGDSKTGASVFSGADKHSWNPMQGAIVVADALHRNRNSAKAVVDAGADYLLCVKDNQRNLREAIEHYVQEEALEKATAQEKNGGRIETRTAYVSREIDWLGGREEWARLACIGAIHTQFEKDGHKSSNWHYSDST